MKFRKLYKFEKNDEEEDVSLMEAKLRRRMSLSARILPKRKSNSMKTSRLLISHLVRMTN